MRFWAMIAAMCLALMPLPALAGTFDGKWLAEIPPQQDPCNGISMMRVLVSDTAIMGEVHTPWGHNTFTGKIDAEGSGSFSFGRDGGTIKFSGDHFDANWSNERCGQRHALGDREPSDARKAEMVIERKQIQDRFAALVADAEAGKAVDYGQLRAAYPYTTAATMAKDPDTFVPSRVRQPAGLRFGLLTRDRTWTRSPRTTTSSAL